MFYLYSSDHVGCRAAIFALKATNRMQALIKSMRVTNMAVKFALVYSLEHVEMLYDEFEVQSPYDAQHYD
jgi:hypothetical protein